jgi:hypothetical protein
MLYRMALIHVRTVRVSIGYKAQYSGRRHREMPCSMVLVHKALHISLPSGLGHDTYIISSECMCSAMSVIEEVKVVVKLMEQHIMVELG